jgi:hypothetical protein
MSDIDVRKTILVFVGLLLITGLIYQCSPASDPRYKECMRDMTSRGVDAEDAMRICN